MHDAILRLAEISKKLKQGEFRVLFDLTIRADGRQEVLCSSRELSRSTGLTRGNVRIALEGLNQKLLVKSIPDSGGIRPTLHRLLFSVPERLGGTVTNPPSARSRAAAGGGAR